MTVTDERLEIVNWHKLTRQMDPKRGPMRRSEATTIERHVAIGTPPSLVALILRRTHNWTKRAYKRVRTTGSAMPRRNGDNY